MCPPSRTAIVALALTIGGVAHAQQAPQPPRPQAFIDRLGALDEQRWRVADGWSNGDWAANDWRRSQIRRSPRGMEITLARTRGGEKRFSSGELQSEDTYRYGYFETRLQAPRGSGLVTGFFTFARPGGEASWDEIDIEILGRDTRSIQLTYYRRGANHITTLPLPFDAAEGEHSYGFEWTPRVVRWYVDGAMIHEETGANGPLPQSAQRLYLHMWNTETLSDWLGPIVASEGPWRLNVYCIAYAPHSEGVSLCGQTAPISPLTPISQGPG
jgi:endo-1,3-1,4-beta-glycanase ExoK